MGTVIGPAHIIWYFHPEPVEEILSSNEHISKSLVYDPLLVSGIHANLKSIIFVKIIFDFL